MRRAKDAKYHVDFAAALDIAAPRLGDEAQVVYPRDEGAYKGEVDEAYEARVVGGAVVAEEGEDGPS